MKREKAADFKKPFLISISAVIMVLLGLNTTGHAASLKTIPEAQQAVDDAWEVYHQAALSGTIATPAIQNQIEADLDNVRNLLVEARDMEKTEPKRFNHFLKKIGTITQNIVRASLLVKP